MATEGAARIERIRGKIAACAEIYKQKNKAIEQNNETARRKYEVIDHRWPVEMNPVLSEQEIQVFEKKYKIQLPADYRLFLKEIGNGGVGGSSESGMFPLGVGEKDKPGKPFPLTDLWEWEVDENPKRRDIAAACDNGAISLCSFSGEEYARLIVNGIEHGNVWIISPYAAYYAEGPDATEDSEPTRIGFLQWYEYWLDERLEPSAE